MYRLLFLALAIPFAALAQAPAPAAKAPPITPTFPGTCTIVGNQLITDMRDTNCFPQFDEAKCSYFIQVPVSRQTGASPADVADAKKHGLAFMNYANSQACEGKSNCGFYVMQFASAATCDGKVEQAMPGGEYRGLTAAALRNVQARANREGEAASKTGKARGTMPKSQKTRAKSGARSSNADYLCCRRRPINRDRWLPHRG